MRKDEKIMKLYEKIALKWVQAIYIIVDQGLYPAWG